METKETKVLLASQKEAQRVLTDARDEAQRLLVEAHEKAMAMLLRQQDEAARLLLKQQDEAKVNSFQSMTEAMQLPAARREAMLAQHRQDADALLDAQQVATELLVSAQADAAVLLRDSIQRAAADVLLTSHKRGCVNPARCSDAGDGRVEGQRDAARFGVGSSPDRPAVFSKGIEQ